MVGDGMITQPLRGVRSGELVLAMLVDPNDGIALTSPTGEAWVQWITVTDMAEFTAFPIPTKTFDPAQFAGSDGREVELQASATHIQWRYVGDLEWNNLVALDDLLPADAVTSSSVRVITVVEEGMIPDPPDPDTLYIVMPV